MTISVAVIGGGKLGTALGRQLAAAGYRITGVCCRTMESARRAAAVINTDKAVTVPWEITPEARLVLLTTPDGEIAATYRAIADHDGFSPDAIVLHCSGAHPSTILKATNDSGLAKGSFHPLQSFAAAKNTDDNPFRGINAAIEGDARALIMAGQLGDALGVTCFTIRTEAKAMYHAAAAVALNYLVTLVDIALSLLASAGINRRQAITILSPLLEGTLTNIKTVGIPEALTGPIARGDIATIADHLDAIGTHKPDLLAVYSRLGLHTIPLAVNRGSLATAQAEALKRLLDRSLGG